ncbi:MAG: WYL domain-containing protein [Spirochaetaceae bacterium]|jgi:predicted DNA-binding transcriptional regulator YafY|nr:WYL domain-containing protein [Spirochaetaceae bacterium]
MKAERLISMVLLLERHNKLTASELSIELGVTQRTIYRDIEALCLAGIPIFSETGPKGGYGLMEGYSSALDQLQSRELKALVTLGAAQFPKDSELQKRYQGAMEKLNSALARNNQKMDSREKVIIDNLQSREYQGIFDQLYRACNENRWINLLVEYEVPIFRIKLIKVKPLGLISHLQRWYLIYQLDLGIRRMELSSIHKVEIQRETFDPQTFDIHDYWQEEKNWINEENKRFKVRFIIPEMMQRDIRHRIYNGKIPQAAFPKDWKNQPFVEVQMNFSSLEEARYRLLPFGAAIEVTYPKSLIQSMRALLEGGLRLYQANRDNELTT